MNLIMVGLSQILAFGLLSVVRCLLSEKEGGEAGLILILFGFGIGFSPTALKSSVFMVNGLPCLLSRNEAASS